MTYFLNSDQQSIVTNPYQIVKSQFRYVCAIYKIKEPKSPAVDLLAFEI